MDHKDDDFRHAFGRDRRLGPASGGCPLNLAPRGGWGRRLLIVRRMVPALLGGADPATPRGSSDTSSTGPIVAGDAPPAPEGSRSSVFPATLAGTRLELKVVGLGDHPPRCRAQLLLVGDEERSVFHHRCASGRDEGITAISSSCTS